MEAWEREVLAQSLEGDGGAVRQHAARLLRGSYPGFQLGDEL